MARGVLRGAGVAEVGDLPVPVVGPRAARIGARVLARYYFRRIAMVEAYVRDTPAWVVEVQRAASLD